MGAAILLRSAVSLGGRQWRTGGRKLPGSYCDLRRRCGGRSVERKGRREVPVSVDLRLQVGDFLLRGGNGIGARDKSERRWLLPGNHDERPRELRRVAGLLAILGSPELELLRSALAVGLD